MKYAVMTTWKHKNPIEWDNMTPQIDSTPEGTTVQWFAIDEHNHGSFSTYASKEVYKTFKVTFEEQREEQVVKLDIEKTMDAVGPIHADAEISRHLTKAYRH